MNIHEFKMRIFYFQGYVEFWTGENSRQYCTCITASCTIHLSNILYMNGIMRNNGYFFHDRSSYSIRDQKNIKHKKTH